MLKTIIILLFINFASLATSIICFCLPTSPTINWYGIGIICVIIFLAALFAEIIIFMLYTNKYHDLNKPTTIECSKIEISNLTEIKVTKLNGNLNFNLNGNRILFLNRYPFKRAFIIALIVRIIYYKEFTQKNRVGEFFKSHELNNLKEITELSLDFTYKRNQKKFVIKNKKVRFGPLVSLILKSKFLHAIVINNHYATDYKKTFVKYSEEWFLHGR